MGFWSRHKRKIIVVVGAFGCGYALYKIYDLHRRRSIKPDEEFEAKRRADELVGIQLQIHFESIQRISETTTLPHAMANLRFRISEELDISPLTEKLMQGKGQGGSLQPSEKLDLWNQLKVLSFTRTVTSLWAMITLFLYVRVQVNILGRQLYLEAARGFATSSEVDEANQFGQQEFLATADYLSDHGIASLILKMKDVTFEVLRDKQLRDSFSLTHLSQTIMDILDLFMSCGSPDSWISYVVPETAAAHQQSLAMSSSGFDNSNIQMDTSRLEQLMLEARSVLSCVEFKNIVKITTKTAVDCLMEDLSKELDDTAASYPLAKLLPRVARLGPAVLEEAGNNRYIKRIRGLPEVDLFYTLIYADTSQAASMPLCANA